MDPDRSFFVGIMAFGFLIMAFLLVLIAITAGA